MVLDKHLNFILAERRFREKVEVLDSYPYHAFIDPSTVCNLHCPFCAVGGDSYTSPKYLMKLEEFKRIMDMVGRYLFQVELYQYGEPLINPAIYQMIEYAKKKYYVYTRISTNLNISGEENAEKLVASGLDYLTLSIDGASQETYSRYRVGGDFNKVLENLNLIIAAKNALKSQSPKLVWQFLLFRHNEHEVEKAKALAEKMGLIFSLMPASIRPEEKDWFPSREAVERYGLEGAVEYKGDNVGPKVEGPRICKWLWTHLIVDSNGSVSPCCRLPPSDAAFGNIHQSKDFFDLWNNDRFRSARRFFIFGKKQTPETFCEICPLENRDIVPLSVILPNVPSRKLRAAAKWIYCRMIEPSSRTSRM
jgi:radical SAM protein with 4Fe4S-binding SPASM domain